MRRLLILLFVSLAQSAFAVAHDYYIANAAIGSGDGSNAANAAIYTFFNTSGNWSGTPGTSGKISPGDTVHIVGTLANPLTSQGSGSAGNVITIIFESGSSMSAAYWPTGAALGNIPQAGAITCGHDYITIDGNNVGSIVATNNGTSLATQWDCVGILLSTGNHQIVKNLTIANMYVRSVGDDQAGQNSASIQKNCTNLVYNRSGFTDFRVTNCIMHDACGGVQMDYDTGGVTAVEIDHNTFYNMDKCCFFGDRNANSTASNILFHDNVGYNWTLWDDPTGSNHHNFCFFWTTKAGTTLSNVRRYNNTGGYGMGGSHQTSAFYTSCNDNTAAITDFIDYNNVFHSENGAGDYPSNGYFYYLVNKNSAVQCYNNTVVGGGSGIGINLDTNSTAGTATYTVKNNVLQNLNSAISIFDATYVAATVDYNLGYKSGGQTYSYSTSSSSVSKSFAQWQGLGFDTHGLSSDPLLSGTYRLSAGSPAIGTGTDLSAYFTTDAAGYTRTVPWDIGAYKWLGGGSGLLGILSLSGNASIK